jgi:hypothetical protein
MPNLWWIYYPEFYPKDVILLNFESRDELSLRLYENRDARPRKLHRSDLGDPPAGDILRLSAWSETAEGGINVDERPEWWYARAREALRKARAATSG